MISLDLCVLVTGKFAGLWAFLSGVEWLVARRVLSTGGLLSWEIIGSGQSQDHRVGRLLFSDVTTLLIAGARVVAGVVILIGESATLTFIASLLIVCSYLYFSKRAPFGMDGSDQMGFVLTTGYLIMALGNLQDDEGVKFLGVVAVAGQALLAYSIAGLSKFVSTEWRKGNVLPLIMNTEAYGNAWAYSFLKAKPKVAAIICSLVIYGEMLAPLVLIAPSTVIILALALLGTFHVINAYFMGLGSFLVPFLGSYPSILYLSEAVGDAL